VSEAVFALVGALVGVTGALATEVVRARRDDVRQRRRDLLSSCVDFTAAVMAVRQIAWNLCRFGSSERGQSELNEADSVMRTAFQRLRLVSTRVETQEAARYAVRYAHGLARLTRGRPLREDETETHPVVLLDDWLARLHVSVRRELGMSQADEIFRERPEWQNWPGMRQPPAP
jgi:hypothetical protein